MSWLSWRQPTSAAATTTEAIAKRMPCLLANYYSRSYYYYGCSNETRCNRLSEVLQRELAGQRDLEQLEIRRGVAPRERPPGREGERVRRAEPVLAVERELPAQHEVKQ